MKNHVLRKQIYRKGAFGETSIINATLCGRVRNQADYNHTSRSQRNCWRSPQTSPLPAHNRAIFPLPAREPFCAYKRLKSHKNSRSTNFQNLSRLMGCGAESLRNNTNHGVIGAQK
jgi:hypothetical protein